MPSATPRAAQSPSRITRAFISILRCSGPLAVSLARADRRARASDRREPRSRRQTSPPPQLLDGPGPPTRQQVRQATRLLGEEEDDETAKDDLLEVLEVANVDDAPQESRRQVVERDRHEHDERRAQEGGRQ